MQQIKHKFSRKVPRVSGPGILNVGRECERALVGRAHRSVTGERGEENRCREADGWVPHVRTTVNLGRAHRPSALARAGDLMRAEEGMGRLRLGRGSRYDDTVPVMMITDG
jgi:hypothetical protein